MMVTPSINCATWTKRHRLALLVPHLTGMHLVYIVRKPSGPFPYIGQMNTPHEDRPTAQDYADIFEVDKRGARIFEDLVRRFVRPAVSAGGIDAVLQTFERGGQRKVIDFIANQINRANGLPDDQDSGD